MMAFEGNKLIRYTLILEFLDVPWLKILSLSFKLPLKLEQSLTHYLWHRVVIGWCEFLD